MRADALEATSMSTAPQTGDRLGPLGPVQRDHDGWDVTALVSA
jgi:hypothetical protein